MVVILNGRYEIPEDLYFDSLQHLFLDPVQKTIGIDQIGYFFLKNPSDIILKVEDRVVINEVFAEIICENGTFPLRSLCTGKIKRSNASAFHFKDYDTYSKGFILEFESFEQLAPGMITGDQIQEYVDAILKSILLDHYTFKILMVGEKGAGKSSLRKSFITKTFDPDVLPSATLDMDAITLDLKILHQHQEHYIPVTLNFWDIGGSCGDIEREIYYREADAVIIVYDIKNPPEFSCSCSCFSIVREILGQRVPGILVANKIDLSAQIDTNTAQKFAQEQNLLFAQCSAKTLEGVDAVLMKILGRLLLKYAIELI